MSRGVITEEKSIRGGKGLVWEKDLLEEIRDACQAMSAGEPWESTLRNRGWETEYVVTVGENLPRLDAYKNGVGLEHETREQMNVRSHLLWMEAAYQQGVIDVGTFVIPAGSDGSLHRTARELQDVIFTEHFPIECPMYLVEYEP